MLYTECPNCRQPIPRVRLFFVSAWGRWRCGACGALLGIDVRRRLLALIPWIVILFLLLGVMRIASQGLLISVPVLVAAALLNFFLFDRPVVHEHAGFRCRMCGYNLQGQTEPRCPECGQEFDLVSLDAYRASGPGPKQVPSRFRTVIVFVLVLVFLATAVIVGFTRYRAARGTALATQPATAPSGMRQSMEVRRWPDVKLSVSA